MSRKKKINRRMIMLKKLICYLFIIIFFIVFFIFFLLYKLISYPIRKSSFDKSKFYELSGYDYKTTMKNYDIKFIYKNYKIISKMFNSDDILFDIYLNNNELKTKIDMLLISKSHIYIFKIRPFNGRIAFNKDEEAWYQYKDDKKYLFYSPIIQNKNNKNALNELLNFKDIIVSPIIVFPNNAKFKSNDLVIKISELKKTLDNLEVLDSINNEEKKRIKSILLEYKNITEEEKNRYLEQKDELYTVIDE